ncbi:MAG: hypothetical protein JW770_06085 [Actinobacteria bacterium]|nr:hypothetical protein [Actinomycetota bacterium]
MSAVSWLYNFFVYHDADILGLAIWWLTNLFPFFVILLIIRLDDNVDKDKLVDFYRYILLIEFLIIIIQSAQENVFYGDHASGTCYDAHVLAVHFSIGIILTLGRIFTDKNKRYGINFLVLFIFYTGTIITAFKANTVFLFIILIVFFLYQLIKKIVIYKKSIRKYLIILISLLLIIVVGLITLTQTYMLRDMKAATEMTTDKISTIQEEYDTENWISLERWGGKIYAYYVSFLKVPAEINFVSGYGPATYTSRAAQYRMRKMTYYAEKILGDRFGLPEEKVADITGYFEPRISRIYDKYLFKIRFNSTINAPLTSVISIWVELGILGIAFFIFFFVYLFLRLKRANKLRGSPQQPLFYENDFYALLIVLLIFNMFYYNYWEYPEMVIPVMTFIFLTSNYNKGSIILNKNS